MLNEVFLRSAELLRGVVLNEALYPHAGGGARPTYLAECGETELKEKDQMLADVFTALLKRRAGANRRVTSMNPKVYLSRFQRIDDEEPHLRTSVHQKELKTRTGDRVRISARRRRVFISANKAWELVPEQLDDFHGAHFLSSLACRKTSMVSRVTCPLSGLTRYCRTHCRESVRVHSYRSMMRNSHPSASMSRCSVLRAS